MAHNAPPTILICLPDQLQEGDESVRQEDEPEDQVDLLVNNVHWQGAQSGDLGNGGSQAKGVH